MRAEDQARLRLRATTTLDAEQIEQAIRAASDELKGERMIVEKHDAKTLKLIWLQALTKKKVWTITATTESSSAGSTLTVGGLTYYRTQQNKLLIFIPFGPKRILGYDTYKRVLHLIEVQLLNGDPKAAVDTSVPVIGSAQR